MRALGTSIYQRLTGFAGRWAAAAHRADRVGLAIARDQLEAWAIREDSRQRRRALLGYREWPGWAGVVRLYATAAA